MIQTLQSQSPTHLLPQLQSQQVWSMGHNSSKLLLITAALSLWVNLIISIGEETFEPGLPECTGLNRRLNNISNSIAAAQSAVSIMSNLDSFELGNEPDCGLFFLLESLVILLIVTLPQSILVATPSPMAKRGIQQRTEPHKSPGLGKLAMHLGFPES